MNTPSAAHVKRGAQLKVETLLARARKDAGLSDFGDPWFLAPLGHIVELVNADGGLKSDDEPPVRDVVARLADRLRLVEYMKHHPQVRDEVLDVAGVIIGLPRGGSTLLQRLLSTSPQLTSTHHWEARFPLPEPGEVHGDHRHRIAAGQAAIDAVFAEWPEMKSMHPMDAMTYEEEIMLIDRSFLSMNYAHYFNIPSYDHWEMHQDHTKAYDELRLWLQILQYNAPQRKGKRWLLKSPHHLLGGGVRMLMKTFPKAKVIMTHRTLESVISSYCSIQATTIRNYSTTFDETKSGGYIIRLFTEALQNLIAVRKENPADRFIDVQYKDVIADPLGQFRRAMTLMGLTVTAEDENAAATWMAQNGRDTHPRHKYAPEDYGVTAAQLQEAFTFYREAFLK